MKSKTQVALHAVAVIFNYLVMAGDIPLPPTVKPYVVLGVAVAQGFLGWYNHYYNPDGTPAQKSWTGAPSNPLKPVLILALLLPATAHAQTVPDTPTPNLTTFSITAGGASVPGLDGNTLPGTIMGTSLKVTPNFSLDYTCFLTSGAQTNAYMGGGSYTITALSKKLNNISPTLPGYDFRFSVHGDAGVARISAPTGVTQGFSALFGGQVDYAIKGSSTYSLGVRIDDFFVQKGLPSKNNLVVAVGPTIHF